MNMLQKRDMILVAAMLLMAAATFSISRYTRRAPAVIVQMSLDGTVVKTPNLSRDTETTVTSPNGGTNHLIVKDSEIWCSGVSCPNRVYARQGKKHLNSDTVVCLPNQVTIAIAGGE